MKVSKGTDYALHALYYMINKKQNETTSVKELSDFLDVSTTYLSKILALLVKSNIVQSISGPKGGYSLPINWTELSFFDVITAIEGNQNMINDNFNHGLECIVYRVLSESEQKMNDLLIERKLTELLENK